MSVFIFAATCPGTRNTGQYWSSDSRYAATPATVAEAIFDVIEYTGWESRVDKVLRNLHIDVPHMN
jgi:hypothetical protein